jgi:hypothetical protein
LLVEATKPFPLKSKNQKRNRGIRGNRERKKEIRVIREERNSSGERERRKRTESALLSYTLFLSLSLSIFMAGAARQWSIWAIAISFGFLAVLLALDPWKLSIISNAPNFVANYGFLDRWAPSSAAAEDALNRLQNATIMKLTEFGGAESLAFDSHGRGPYTGVADGRIVMWNGDAWIYFAHTSPNWFVLYSRWSSFISVWNREIYRGFGVLSKFREREGFLDGLGS